MRHELATFQGSYLTPSYEHARVVEAMHPGLFACDPGDSLVDVARIMASQHVHCVAVMTGDDHQLQGVISGLDLLRAAGGDKTAGEISSREFVTARAEEPLAPVVERMVDAGVMHALVTRDGRPVGALSTADVAGVIAWGRG